MTPLIATHAFAALTSLVLGGWQVFRSPKGTNVHRFVGRVWVGLMLFVSISSFWLRDLREGQFSFLHILSVVTIVTVSLGVNDARRGNLRSHLGNMCGSWIGLCFAFAFAVAIPARHVPQFVLTEPIQATGAALAVVATAVAFIAAGRVLTARERVSASAT